MRQSRRNGRHSTHRDSPVVAEAVDARSRRQPQRWVAHRRRPVPRRVSRQGQRQLAASSTCPAAGSTIERLPSDAMPAPKTPSPTAIVRPRPEPGRTSDMKVDVDFDMCASTGACMQMCPEVFEVRSDGYLYVLQEEPREELRTPGDRGRRHVPDGGDHPRAESTAHHERWRCSARHFLTRPCSSRGTASADTSHVFRPKPLAPKTCHYEMMTEG